MASVSRNESQRRWRRKGGAKIEAEAGARRRRLYTACAKWMRENRPDIYERLQAEVSERD